MNNTLTILLGLGQSTLVIPVSESIREAVVCLVQTCSDSARCARAVCLILTGLTNESTLPFSAAAEQTFTHLPSALQTQGEQHHLLLFRTDHGQDLRRTNDQHNLLNLFVFTQKNLHWSTSRTNIHYRSYKHH